MAPDKDEIITALEHSNKELAQKVIDLMTERDLWRRRAEKMFWLLPDEVTIEQIR